LFVTHSALARMIELARSAIAREHTLVVPELGEARARTTELVDPAEAPADGVCLLPALPDDHTESRILLQRVGSHASLTIGNAHSECLVSARRLAVGVCASKLGPARVTRVSVTR